MRSVATAGALALAASMLAACGGGRNVGSSAGPRVESASQHTITTRGVTAPSLAADTADSGPHGPEVDSGPVITVTDGNVHMAYPAGATVTRTGDGVLVLSHGHARKFSAAAVVMQSGSYHVYAPVAH